MSSGLSDSDWQRLETRFKALEDKVDGKESKIHKLDLEINTLKLGSVHRCSDAVQKHEAQSWAHNPYKASGLIAGILGVFESAKKFFGSH